MDIEKLADKLNKVSDSMAHDHIEIGAAIIQTTQVEAEVPEGPVVDCSKVAKEMLNMVDQHKDMKISMQEHVRQGIARQLFTDDAAVMGTRALDGIEGAWSILSRAQDMGARLQELVYSAACQLDGECGRESASRPEDMSCEDKVIDIMRRTVDLAGNYIKTHGGQQPTA